MRKIWIAALSVMFLAMPVFATEVPPLPVPKPERSILDDVRKARKELCKTSPDPKLCTMEFDAIEPLFALGQTFLMTAAIAHPGASQDYLQSRGELYLVCAEQLYKAAVIGNLDERALQEMVRALLPQQ